MFQLVINETCCHHYMGYSFWLTGLFYMHHRIDRIAHTMIFVIPAVEHWLEQKKLNGSTERDWSDDPSHHEPMLYHGAK